MNYIKKNKYGDISFTFIESKKLPNNFPITTPLTFAFIGYDLVLTQKKNDIWDILGGKIKPKEKWQDALKRETMEEAGVEIDNIKVLGYIMAEHNNTKINFPKKSILPVTISFVKRVEYNWKKFETLDRNFFRKKIVLKKFLNKNDNKQLYKIYQKIVYPFLQKEYIVDFKFTKKLKDFEIYPVTQTMTFIKINKKYLVVKDFNEKNFSLVGGGCNMDENIFSSARREILEEAQIKIDELYFLGSVLIKILDKKGKIVSKSQQVRFLTYKNNYNINNFIKRKDNFEIEEIKIINFNDLKNTKILNNKNGKKILSELKKYV